MLFWCNVSPAVGSIIRYVNATINVIWIDSSVSIITKKCFNTVVLQVVSTAYHAPFQFSRQPLIILDHSGLVPVHTTSQHLVLVKPRSSLPTEKFSYLIFLLKYCRFPFSSHFKDSIIFFLRKDLFLPKSFIRIPLTFSTPSTLYNFQAWDGERSYDHHDWFKIKSVKWEKKTYWA